MSPAGDRGGSGRSGSKFRGFKSKPISNNTILKILVPTGTRVQYRIRRFFFWIIIIVWLLSSCKNCLGQTSTHKNPEYQTHSAHVITYLHHKLITQTQEME